MANDRVETKGPSIKNKCQLQVGSVRAIAWPYVHKEDENKALDNNRGEIRQMTGLYSNKHIFFKNINTIQTVKQCFSQDHTNQSQVIMTKTCNLHELRLVYVLEE